MTKRKLIIFDLDGTLVDSLDDLTASVNHMLSAFGRKLVGRDAVRRMVGQGARSLVERAMPGAHENDIRHGLDIFLAHNENHLADRTVPFPDVVSTLTALQQAGHVMVVVTNKNESLSRALLATLHLTEYFRDIYGADSLPSRKPSPEPLVLVMAELGYSPEATLMVGDSINDIVSGNGAGVATIGCTWGYGDDLELAEASWRIDRFAELLQLPPVTECK